MKIARTIVLLPAMAIGILFIACGGGDDEGGSPAPTAETASAEVTEDGQSDTLSDTVEVTVEEYSFSPDSFDVPKGKPITVKVEDKGSTLHTLTVFEDEAFTTQVPGAHVAVSPTQPGEFTVTFDEAGTRYFRCGIHPAEMQGEITVR